MQEKVKFSGWMEEAGFFYQSIDLFVLASRHDEGYGLVVAEAMSHGKPVVITESGGAVEIVQDGINGYIVPKRDEKAMADRICKVSTDRNIYTGFSEKGVLRIKDHFTIERAAARFSAILQTII